MEEAQWLRIHHKYCRKRPRNWQLNVINGESWMYGRTPQILQKNTHKRAMERSPWDVAKWYKYNICAGGNTRKAFVPMTNGRSSMYENTHQIIKKKGSKLAVESGQWRKLSGWQDATNIPKNKHKSALENNPWNVLKWYKYNKCKRQRRESRLWKWSMEGAQWMKIHNK